MMEQLKKKYLDVLEELEWNVCDYTHDGYVEIETWSPAGEDLIICAKVEDFPKEIQEEYENFDVDDHVAEWLMAKYHGVKGIPCARTLVHDAEEIEKMLEDLMIKIVQVR